MPSIPSLAEATQKAKTRHLFLPFTHDIAGSWTAENVSALNVDCIGWIVLGAINSNLTFIFDLNYLPWKLNTSKRQGVSSLHETKHKIFQFKTKKIPRIMSVQDAKSSLKILVANAQLSVALATGWS